MRFLKTFFQDTFLYNILRNQRFTKQDKNKLLFYYRFIKPGDLCFDVGANIGNRTKVFSQLGASVVAVEPQVECVEKLKTLFKNDKRVMIVNKAVGDTVGTAEIFISDMTVLSSLSKEWIEAVKSSGRFGENKWDQKFIVSVTTLDNLIEQYGTPAFIKIDVEGFEYQVLKGLTRPVKFISLEFTPEIIDSALCCVDYLSELGNIRLNYSLGESMTLSLKKWVSPQKLKEILVEYKGDHKIFGDIYAYCSPQTILGEMIESPTHTAKACLVLWKARILNLRNDFFSKSN
jgi:FkbM family methyltransferase